MLSSSRVVTRFAPSPTGYMTLGNYRTALWAYLYALKHQGRFLLRIEDTDSARSQDDYVEGLFRDLRDMGIQFDSSEVWYQSKRNEIYNQILDELNKSGQLYECFCTAQELELERKVQLAQKKPPRYSGRCRHLSEEQKKALRAQGKESVLRFSVQVPLIEMTDLVLGPKSFFGDDIGDFVVRKSDGDSTFFFSNAMDDSLSGVTHALRGDDHLTNTPRQLALLRSLGMKEPSYGHLPLILGHDHKPLSKRNGSVAISQLLAQGYTADAINNYCARLGHHIESQELLSLDALAQHFSLDHISASAAHFDPAQLLFWQKKALMLRSLDEWNQVISDYLRSETVRNLSQFSQIVASEILVLADLDMWYQILHTAQAVDLKNFDFSQYGWNPDLISEIHQKIGQPWAEILNVLQQNGIKGKKAFYPLRYLLTGKAEGPHLEPMYQYIDPEILKTRLQAIL